MSEQKHSRIVMMEGDGRLAIGIDRVFARKFYTDVPLTRIAQETGEKIYFEKTLIWVLFLAVHCGFVATALFSVLAFKWWRFLVIPGCVFLWFFYASQSVRGTSKAWFISAMLLAAFVTAFTQIIASYIALFFLAFILTLWITRLLYLLSTFLTSLFRC